MLSFTLITALVLTTVTISPARGFALAPEALGASDFTLMVIPDTQNYVKDQNTSPIFGQQTQWIANTRDELKTSFVTHLGDIVDTWTDQTQWQRASQHLATLDNANIPNSVLPGNHDMSITGQFFLYNDYFPVTRYSTAGWNSDSTKYGGYLGQSQFGQDPVNRQNMDNYALLTAGGLDFILINLEFEAPDYALAWARKILAAYPDRRAIISTHKFLHAGGARSNELVRTDAGANTANQIWDKLIFPSCSVFMVLGGHFHDGDVAESRRTDLNACGNPVHQLLTDYQGRANGGDGWLRYYTFRPALDRIEAVTYSPKLQEYETDDSSDFDLTYDMTPGGPEEKALVPANAEWRWRYQNAAWPANWSSVEFDDSGWSSGRAPFGFNAPEVVTNIDVPPPTSNRPRSAQFRKSFTVEDPAKISHARIVTRADDGVVVFVNGTEVGRANMGTGLLNSNSYATAAPRTAAANATPVVIDIPSSLLRAGTNIVSASTHLNYRGTTDVTFDLALTATVETVGPPVPVAPAPPMVSVTATSANSLTLSWQHDPGQPIQFTRISRGGQVVADVPASQSSFVDGSLSPGMTYQYSLVSVGVNGLSSSPSEIAAVTTAAPVPVEFVSAGSSWRWQYANVAWPDGWTSISFNDSGWPSAPAVLGFGSASVITNIDVPPPVSNRPRSAQFRQGFDIADPSKVSELSITTRADDGIVVFVNGVEVGRSRMLAGPLSSTSYATAAPRTAQATSAPVHFSVPQGLLIPGRNVVSASVHVNYRATPDLSMQLTLRGMREP